MLRLVFVIFLVLAVVLNIIALLIMNHPVYSYDNYIVTGALCAELITLGIMVWRGKIFQLDGHWEWVKDNEENGHEEKTL